LKRIVIVFSPQDLEAALARRLVLTDLQRRGGDRFHGEASECAIALRSLEPFR